MNVQIHPLLLETDKLEGLSQRLIVSHHENINAIRRCSGATAQPCWARS